MRYHIVISKRVSVADKTDGRVPARGFQSSRDRLFHMMSRNVITVSLTSPRNQISANLQKGFTFTDHGDPLFPWPGTPCKPEN